MRNYLQFTMEALRVDLRQTEDISEIVVCYEKESQQHKLQGQSNSLLAKYHNKTPGNEDTPFTSKII